MRSATRKYRHPAVPRGPTESALVVLARATLTVWSPRPICSVLKSKKLYLPTAAWIIFALLPSLIQLLRHAPQLHHNPHRNTIKPNYPISNQSTPLHHNPWITTNPPLHLPSKYLSCVSLPLSQPMMQGGARLIISVNLLPIIITLPLPPLPPP